jgi:hypothetical protein
MVLSEHISVNARKMITMGTLDFVPLKRVISKTSWKLENCNSCWVAIFLDLQLAPGERGSNLVISAEAGGFRPFPVLALLSRLLVAPAALPGS